jgi:hypothetical protein
MDREGKLAKVKIFPPSFLNSDPPAMKYQNDDDPVLHLMGEANELRKGERILTPTLILTLTLTPTLTLTLTPTLTQAVFQSAYNHICSSMMLVRDNNEEDLKKKNSVGFPRQLNQTRDSLVWHAEHIYTKLSRDLHEKIKMGNKVLNESLG